MASAADGYWRDRSAARSRECCDNDEEKAFALFPREQEFQKFRYVEIGPEKELTTIERAGVEVKVPGEKS